MTTAYHIAEYLRNPTHYTGLHFHHKSFDESSCRNISNAMLKHRSLESISFCNCDISDEGLSLLTKGLSYHKKIEHIELHNNNIGDKGIKKFAGILYNFKNLSSLMLHGNNIGNEGAKYLARELEYHKKISSLYLRSNDIGNEGAEELAVKLLDCTSLEHFTIDYNIIENSHCFRNLSDFVRHCDYKEQRKIEIKQEEIQVSQIPIIPIKSLPIKHSFVKQDEEDINPHELISSLDKNKYQPSIYKKLGDYFKSHNFLYILG